MGASLRSTGLSTCFVGKGLIAIINPAASSSEIIAVLRAGSFVGESALLSVAAKRNASVQALTWVNLQSLSRDAWHAVKELFPRAMEGVERHVNRAIEQRDAQNRVIAEAGRPKKTSPFTQRWRGSPGASPAGGRGLSSRVLAQLTPRSPWSSRPSPPSQPPSSAPVATTPSPREAECETPDSVTM